MNETRVLATWHSLEQNIGIITNQSRRQFWAKQLVNYFQGKTLSQINKTYFWSREIGKVDRIQQIKIKATIL